MGEWSAQIFKVCIFESLLYFLLMFAFLVFPVTFIGNVSLVVGQQIWIWLMSLFRVA